ELRLTVNDEIENGLAYYRYTFLHQLPKLYAEMEDLLLHRDFGKARLANFFKLGSWIGGDRDGNPFVTDDVMRHAMTRHCATAMDFYFDEIHQLGGELSQSLRMVETTPAIDELAGGSPAVSAHRQDKPY